MFASIREWLTDTVLIERPTVSAGFGQDTTWTTVDTVDGYIRMLSAGESIDYGGDNVRSTHRLVTDVTDISEADRVTIAGSVYLVRYVDTKRLGPDDWLQIDLEYIGAAA